jgi:hypothetical protein
MTQKAGKKRIKNREHLAQALGLRKAGASYDAIGKALGLSKTRAYQLVTAGLDEINETVRDEATAVKRLELERCDDLLMALWPQRKNPRVVDSIIRVMDRRARLEGLDAPVKVAPTLPGGDALPPAPSMDGLPTDLLRQLRDHLKAAQKPEA